MDSIFGVEESYSSFSLLSGGHDIWDDLAVDEDRCIQWWSQIILFDR